MLLVLPMPRDRPGSTPRLAWHGSAWKELSLALGDDDERGVEIFERAPRLRKRAFISFAPDKGALRRLQEDSFEGDFFHILG